MRLFLFLNKMKTEDDWVKKVMCLYVEHKGTFRFCTASTKCFYLGEGKTAADL